jgi:DNA-binding transcriptional LysR family regulator
LDQRIDPNRLPPLQTLQTFSVVAETGSFTAASAQLNLSQSAVSRQIQLLERYFGCVLFERHTRKVIITEKGTALLPIVESLLSNFRNSLETTRSQRRSLTVRMTPTFARRWLLPRLPSFLQAYKDLNINIDTAWQVRPTFGLGDIDVQITYGNGHWPGMDVLPLLSEQLTPVCSPVLAAQLGSPASIDKLASCVLLHSNPRQSDWTLWLQAEGAYALQPLRHQVFDTQDFALTAAASGLGVAMGDLSFVDEEVRTGQLITPFPRIIDSGYGYYAIFPARDDVRRRVADFAHWLESSCHRR